MTYLSPVIEPNEHQFLKLKKILLSFLYPKKNTFSTERTFSGKEVAGIDLPPIEHFLDSLTLNFALRSQKSTQPWALALKELFLDKDIRSAERNANERGGLNLNRYAKLLTSFNMNFFKSYTNIWNSPIFNVPSVIDPESGHYFPTPPPLSGEQLSKRPQ